MGYFNDEYFIEFDDSYSESNRRREVQRRSSAQRGRTQNTSNRRTESRNIDQRNANNRSDRRPVRSDSYRTAYRGERDERRRPKSGYEDDFYEGVTRRRNYPDADSRGTGGRPVRPASQRSVQTQRKRKKFRLTRTSFLAICILVVLTLLISIIAIAVSASGVGEVSSLTVTEVADDRVALSWGKANHAEGYRILAVQGNSEEMQEALTIDDPDAVTATVSDLEQASAYNFSVVALRGQKTGKPVKVSDVYTLPETPEITNSYSAKKGSVHVDWTTNPKVSGYVVQYKKDGGEYSDEMTQTITDPATGHADVTDLEVNATYQVRVYSFLTQNQTLNSAPSAEEAIKVVDQDTEIVPKARALKTNEGLDPGKPMIALTFDDGPSSGGSSDRILDVLEEYNAKATFFMVGYMVDENPNNVKRKAELGMELGNHTWDHSDYGTEVTPDDIRKASSKIYDVTGRYPTCFRSPGGMTTENILKECATENMSAYYWSIDTEDWSSRSADSVYQMVMDSVKDGDIILMHEIYDSTADAVERMVPELIERGFQLVTCHDLVTLKGGAEPAAGVQYVDAYNTLAP